jgi:hemoglobin/transferrin/lactoferrin receptor protein
MYDNGRIIAAYQNIEQDRITRKFGNDMRKTQMENVSVISVNADFSKACGAKNTIKYGLEYTTNDVKSTATFTNVKTDTYTGKADTRYPDGGSTLSTFAGYVMDNFKINEQLNISGGLRFNMVKLNSKFSDTTYFPFPFKDATQNNTAITGNIALVCKPGNDWQINTLFSSGFRAPNVDDMSKVFESGGGILVVPNSNLKPEYAYNSEIGLNKVFNNKIQLSAVFFYTLLNNAMITKNYKMDGKDSVVFQGILSKVQASQNVDKAYVYGYNLVVAWDIDKNFSVKSLLNYTHGTYYMTDQRYYVPLDHIAPLYGQTSVSYKAKKFEGELFSRYSAAKKLEDFSPSGEDNLNYATANGMPGWWTIGIRSGYTITKNFRATFAVENITDNHYRVFASGISAPGRNFIFSLRYKI